MSNTFEIDTVTGSPPVNLDEPERKKRIALVAHDNKKHDLLEWACYNRELLVKHELIATGTTGHMLKDALDTEVTCLQSGPLGGDQQIGSRIAEGDIDLLIFSAADLFLGPARAAAPRHRCKSPAQDRGGLEYSSGLRPGNRRLHYFIPADDRRLRAFAAGLLGHH